METNCILPIITIRYVKHIWHILPWVNWPCCFSNYKGIRIRSFIWLLITSISKPHFLSWELMWHSPIAGNQNQRRVSLLSRVLLRISLHNPQHEAPGRVGALDSDKRPPKGVRIGKYHGEHLFPCCHMLSQQSSCGKKAVTEMAVSWDLHMRYRVKWSKSF